MKTPYIHHLFGDDALAKVAGHLGWLTVGVASSIAWPQDDVWLEYDGAEYLLHGARQEGEHSISPSISTPAKQNNRDEALARVYRFTSVLGFYKRGYVDITGQVWGGRMIRYSTSTKFATLLQSGYRTFNCNHMPVIEDDQVRKALAFLREGRRLEHVHSPYSFLSFFKVIESQFKANDRIAWVERNLALLTDEQAVKRINELTGQGVNVNRHLFDSGRCAIAHASVGGNIVDPDIPADRRRIASDLDIIAALAIQYIKVDAGVPDESDLYRIRDRVAPWHDLMPAAAVTELKNGGQVAEIGDLGRLNDAIVSVRLWPDSPPKQFETMKLMPTECGDGVLKFILLSARSTILLAFAMDVANGRIHTLLDESGIRDGSDFGEEDVEDFTRYFHSVVANRTVELTIDGAEPVDCDVVIPINIIPRIPEEAVAQALIEFRLRKAQNQ